MFRYAETEVSDGAVVINKYLSAEMNFKINSV